MIVAVCRDTHSRLMHPEEILLLMPPSVLRLLDGEVQECPTCKILMVLDYEDFRIMADWIRARLAVTDDAMIPAAMYRVTARCLNGHETVWRPEPVAPLPITADVARGHITILPRRCVNCDEPFYGSVDKCKRCRGNIKHPNARNHGPSLASLSTEERQIAKAMFVAAIGPRKKAVPA